MRQKWLPKTLQGFPFSYQQGGMSQNFIATMELNSIVFHDYLNAASVFKDILHYYISKNIP